MSDPRESGEASFLSRWSRRKTAAREGKPLAEEPVQPPASGHGAAVAPVPPSGNAAGPAEGAAPAVVPAPPAPTLDDVAQLKPGEEIARFVASGVDESVKRAALKTLFSDPHFNVMDGLDIYIDDYTKPDPIPPEVLRRLTQSESLRLFEPLDDEVQAAASVAGDGVAPDVAQAAAENTDPTPVDETAPPSAQEDRADIGKEPESPDAQASEAATDAAHDATALAAGSASEGDAGKAPPDRPRDDPA
ncbi:DUF3306 domain-containing protein [Paracidovorax citrulli]